MTSLKQDGLPSLSVRKEVRRPALIGAGILAAFFGSLLLWSVYAPLTGAVIAAGSVAPEGSTRVVQHLEGGIIDELLVKEGDRVSRGTPLVRLRDVRARSQYDILKIQAFVLRVIEERLRAEQQGDAEWTPSLNSTENAEIGEILLDQRKLFDLHRRGLREEMEMLSQRIQELEANNAALTAQNKAAEMQRASLGSEINMIESLYKKGLESLPQLYRLQRNQAAISEVMEGRSGSIERAKVQIRLLRIQMRNLETKYHAEIEANLETNTTRQIEVTRRLREAEDVFLRTIIFAPIDGTVTQLRHHTIGAVLQPGDPVLHIVPSKESLVVEAHIRPIDIDDVSASQPAQVRLLAGNYRNVDPIDAKVETVSADLYMDPRNGERYYLARLQLSPLNAGRPERADGSWSEHTQLTAGMPVEVMITTRPQSIIQYVLTPLTSAFRRSLKES
jgi:HlyD family secretion protein